MTKELHTETIDRVVYNGVDVVLRMTEITRESHYGTAGTAFKCTFRCRDCGESWIAPSWIDLSDEGKDYVARFQAWFRTDGSLFTAPGSEVQDKAWKSAFRETAEHAERHAHDAAVEADPFHGLT